MKYFVSQSVESDWRIDPRELESNIKTRWPDAAIADGLDPRTNQLVTWSLTTESGARLDGSLNSARDAIVLEGDIDDCAVFALWFRDWTPRNLDLLFYDESFNADVRLVTVKNVEDIVSKFELPRSE